MPKFLEVKEYCTQSVLSDLEKNVKSTVLIKDNNFENGINKILEKKPKYISTSAKQAIPYFISDERIKDKFVHACASMSELESKLLSNMFIMIGNSMRFNFVLQKVEVAVLSEDAVSKKAASFQRADGQFVYEGVFLPRETVLEIVRKRFVVITIIMKHQVISSEEEIYTLKPYSKYIDD